MADWGYRIDPEHPLGGEMSDVVRGLSRRLQSIPLLTRFNAIWILALFSFVNGCFSIGLMALAALTTGHPFVFPSLGPTAFLFFYTPTAPTASPRNTILGHAIGAAAGWLSLALFHLTDAGPVLTHGVTWPRLLAAGLSLGLTNGLMVLARSPHPPAGATTLIVSLGLLPHLGQIGVLMAAIVLLTAQAFVINRLAGLPYPLWAPLVQNKDLTKPQPFR